MAKESKEQRAERLAAEQAAAELALAEFRKSIPKRMLEAQVLAEKLGVSSHLVLTAIGPKLVFNDDHNGFYDDEIHYESDEWEIENIEGKLKEIQVEQDAKAKRYILAKETFEKLSKEERVALKEFIHCLYI